jgi:predicted AAA+ superfamily ATPase
VSLIQACADVGNEKTKERETASLIRAAKELRCKALMVITLDYEKVEKTGNRVVVFKPLWKWLIGSPVDSS